MKWQDPWMIYILFLRASPHKGGKLAPIPPNGCSTYLPQKQEIVSNLSGTSLVSSQRAQGVDWSHIPNHVEVRVLPLRPPN